MDSKVLEVALSTEWSKWLLIVFSVIVILTFMFSLVLKSMNSMRKSLKELLPKRSSYPEQFLIENAVSEHLTYMRHETNADRVLLYRIHNGVNDIGNNPLLKVSCFNETLHREASSRMQAIQSTPISFFKSFTATLDQGRYIALSDINCDKQYIDSNLREFIQSSGAKSCYAFPLENTFGELFGFVIIHYTRKAVDLDADKLKWISSRANGLGALISTTRGKE